MQLTLIITAIGLGIAYSAAPGAVNTEAIRRGAAHGARATLLVETGSLIGDSLWALLALTGVTIFAHYLAIQLILGIAGGCFLIRMAWLAFYDAFTHRNASMVNSVSTRGNFATGIVFGIVNPFGLAFWSGLGSSVMASGATGVQFVLFFVGFFTGAVIWSLGISVGVHWGRRWMRPIVFSWISALCGLALGYFGIRVLWATALEWLQHQQLHVLKPAR